MDSWINLAAAVLAVAGALAGLAQYMSFRTKRDRHSDVGRAFARVVAGLAADNTIERLANAAQLRRFWDPDSEFGQDLPYGEDAVKVAVAILKEEPTGPVQKLLGDELRTAPTREWRSYQRANLRNVYWGARMDESPVILRKADFYRADLSEASLRRADLKGAQFREAHLVNATLLDSDCRGANFRFANLRGARFAGAFLEGAQFQDASHVPPEILTCLDERGTFRPGLIVPTGSHGASPDDFEVFVSAPSVMGPHDSLVMEQILRAVSATGARPRRFLRDEYGQAPPLEEISRRISTARCVVAFGPVQMRVSTGVWKYGTVEEEPLSSVDLPTPWNQIEVGIAVGLRKPVMLIRGGSIGGVFDIPQDPGAIDIIDITRPGRLRGLEEELTAWFESLKVAV